MTDNIKYFLLLSSKTAFFKLQDIFPECFLLREKHPQLEPLVCLREDHSCHVNQNCMGILCNRMHSLFDVTLPQVQTLILYFRKRNIPGMGAGIFWRDFREPRVITVNPTGWESMKRWGQAYKFFPGNEFFLGGLKEKTVDDEKNTVDKLFRVR